MLAVKWALSSAVFEGLSKPNLGPKLLTAFFTKMLQVEDDQVHGGRGIAATRRTENLPLRQAQERLKAATQSFLNAPAEGGGLGGKLRRKMLA